MIVIIIMPKEEKLGNTDEKDIVFGCLGITNKIIHTCHI